MALKFAKLGCTIVCWDINLDAAQETAKEVENIGGCSYAFHCDVSVQREVEVTARKVKNVVPHIDIIINNAGIMPCHPFLNHRYGVFYVLLNIIFALIVIFFQHSRNRQMH